MGLDQRLKTQTYCIARFFDKLFPFGFEKPKKNEMKRPAFKYSIFSLHWTKDKFAYHSPFQSASKDYSFMIIFFMQGRDGVFVTRSFLILRLFLQVCYLTDDLRCQLNKVLVARRRLFTKRRIRPQYQEITRVRSPGRFMRRDRNGVVQTDFRTR